jgi:hypothetical protein
MDSSPRTYASCPGAGPSIQTAPLPYPTTLLPARNPFQPPKLCQTPTSSSLSECTPPPSPLPPPPPPHTHTHKPSGEGFPVY